MFEARPASKTVRRSSGNRSASATVVWRLRCYGDVWPKYVLWKAEENWKARGWSLPFGGKNDNDDALQVYDVGRQLLAIV